MCIILVPSCPGFGLCCGAGSGNAREGSSGGVESVRMRLRTMYYDLRLAREWRSCGTVSLFMEFAVTGGRQRVAKVPRGHAADARAVAEHAAAVAACSRITSSRRRWTSSKTITAGLLKHYSPCRNAALLARYLCRCLFSDVPSSPSLHS